MALFDFFKKKGAGKANKIAAVSQSTDNNENISVECNFTVQQQKEWLEVLNRTIPTIMIGGIPPCVDHLLHPRMLEEAGNMLNTVGRIAFEISETLEITNIERALNTSSLRDLIYAYKILCEYASMIKPPYRDSIITKCNYIRSEIVKMEPNFEG